MAGGATFYRYVDAQGAIHLTDDYETVPAEQRAKAEKLKVEPIDVVPGPVASGRNVGGLHIESFGLGIATSIAAVALYALLRGSSKRALKIGFTIATIAVLVSLYLGVMMRASGLRTSSGLASPTEIIDETKRNVDRVNERNQAQEKAINSAQ